MDDSGENLPLREGELIASKYRVGRILGVGGMGFVVDAVHEQLGQRVAIKGLLPCIRTNDEAVARFVREARAAVLIQNEHVARVSDVGTLDDGTPYMVMEYLDGADLSRQLRMHGAMPVEQAVDYVLQAVEAIAEAHMAGIVHRDLKPSNLFLARRSDGTALIKVLDFGISKVTSAMEPQKDITSTTVAMGSPQYMSPEQMRSAKHVDARTDIWALGAILFELIAARPVYDAESFAGLCAMIATDPPPKLRLLRPEVPRELEQVIERCLEKDRELRFPNVAEFATALVAFGTKKSRTSAERIVGTLLSAGVTLGNTVMPDSNALPPPGHTAGAWSARSSDLQTAKKTPRILLAGVAVLLGVLGVFGAKHWMSAPVAPEASGLVGGRSVGAIAIESLPVFTAMDDAGHAEASAPKEAPTDAETNTDDPFVAKPASPLTAHPGSKAQPGKPAAGEPTNAAPTSTEQPSEAKKPPQTTTGPATTPGTLPDFGGREY